ncbi:YdcF family protein [Pedobacter gandavensis]|uniref:DUF218 domain-containing protein n=1 Tax=Pedobacter gandavensis TaxID=2679963 RepID=A0ABR6EZG0_9SPHI|nr:YdcF family protein [Pedobacter gandavensis]MBB2150610.1 hypothetical protein [Pedobacter gandavensis]
MEQRQSQTDIMLYPPCPVMDEKLVNVLTDLCFKQEEMTASDLLFIFGSNVKHAEIAGLITQMIDKKMVDQVIITGGIANFGNSFHQNIPESEAIHAYLPEKYRNHRSILLETCSRNMVENIIEAQKLHNFSHVKTIIFISHAYASKRAALSLAGFFPDKKIYCLPFSLPSDRVEYPINREHWFKTKYGQSLILGEYLRLLTYGNRGDFPLAELQPQLDLVESLLLNK